MILCYLWELGEIFYGVFLARVSGLLFVPGHTLLQQLHHKCRTSIPGNIDKPRETFLLAIVQILYLAENLPTPGLQNFISQQHSIRMRNLITNLRNRCTILDIGVQDCEFFQLHDHEFEI